MKPPLFHPRFQKDLHDALEYYQEQAGKSVADRLFTEVEVEVHQILTSPTLYHFDTSSLRRANLPKFPYHILFFESPDQIAFQVLKHNSRHPSFGLRRKF